MVISTDVTSRLEKLLEEERRKKALLIDEFKKLPKGELTIRKSAGKYFFYRGYRGKWTGIGKDSDLKRKLVRKCVLKNMIAACDINCRLLTKSIGLSRKTADLKGRNLHGITYERIRQLFPAAYYVYSEEQRNWMITGSSKNRFNEAGLKYVTECGIKVRSKSERTIADLLAARHIAFRYEAEFVTDWGSLFPDFMIMRNDGKVIIWEHLGLMDDAEYYRKACDKIERYRREGFVQHTNLICTYEEDIVSTERLNNIIERYIF